MQIYGANTMYYHFLKKFMESYYIINSDKKSKRYIFKTKINL